MKHILARYYKYRIMGQPASPISTGWDAEPPNCMTSQFESSFVAQLKRIVLA